MIRRTEAARVQHMARMIQRKARRERERGEILSLRVRNSQTMGGYIPSREHARRCHAAWDMVHSVQPYPKALADTRARFRPGGAAAVGPIKTVKSSLREALGA